MKKMVLMACLGLLVHSSTVTAVESWQEWKDSRLKSLTKTHGWLTLIGMEWFKKGDNTIGSAEDNSIRLPHGPARIGTFHLATDGALSFTPQPGVEVLVNEMEVENRIPVYADTDDEETTVFTIDTFQFFAIRRGELALRIKDSGAKTRTEFKGLTYFPENDDLRLKARFIPYKPVKKVEIINVLGQLNVTEALGRIYFNIGGTTYFLDALDGGEDAYYLIFADKTNGRSTYGPGRFLYADKATDEKGVMTLDFNKAYNPPCAFNAYSTCSLPPKENRLPVFIEAGEKKYGDSKY